MRCKCVFTCQCFGLKDELNWPILAWFVAVLVKNGENEQKWPVHPGDCFIIEANYHNGMLHIYVLHLVSKILWAGTSLAVTRATFPPKPSIWGKFFEFRAKIVKIFIQMRAAVWVHRQLAMFLIERWAESADPSTIYSSFSEIWRKWP